MIIKDIDKIITKKTKTKTLKIIGIVVGIAYDNITDIKIINMIPNLYEISKY